MYGVAPCLRASALTSWNGAAQLRHALLTVSAAIAFNGQEKRWRLAEFELLFLLGSQLLVGIDTDTTQSQNVMDLECLTSILRHWDTYVDGRQRSSHLRMCQEDFANEVTTGILTLERVISTPLASRLLDAALTAIERNSPAASLLKQVVLEVTTALRQNSKVLCNEIDFEDYIKRLHASEAPLSTTPTPRRPAKHGVFRWEEGLCEWVAKTPYLDHQTESGDSTHELRENAAPPVECSPDILALSPPAKRIRKSFQSPLWSKKVRAGVVVIPINRPKRNVFKRVKENEDESCDELCS